MARFRKLLLGPDASADASLARRACSWRGLSVGIVRIADPYEFSWKGPTHFFAHLDLQRSDGETWATDVARSHAKDLRGRITFIPSGCDLSGWTVPIKRKNVFTSIHLDPSLLSAELDDASSDAALVPMLNFEDRALGVTIAKLGSLLDETGPRSMYAETLGLLLGFEIRRAQRSLPQRGLQQWHGLSCRAEGKVREYIEANLSRDITLTELAELAGLSRFHLARSLQEKHRPSALRYLLQQRIERAKELLGLGTLPVSEIAAAVGFSGAASLARTFVRVTGTTLKEFVQRI